MKKSFSISLGKVLWILLLIFSATFPTGCVKENILTPEGTPPPAPPPPVSNLKPSTSYFLGHKGAGSNNYNDVNMEHSIASFNEALKVLDGVEIDAQMSLDGTIWLFHDTDINYSLCTPGTKHKSILMMHDSEIAAMKLCHKTKTDRVYKFSELMDLWNNSANGFFIDIEIKDAFDSSDYIGFGGELKYLDKMAASMAGLMSNLKHNPSSLIIEDYSSYFTTQFKKFPVGPKLTFWLNNSKWFSDNVADAVKFGFNGVSVSFGDSTITALAIKKAHNLGMQVCIWSPYTDAEVLSVYNMLPDFITTDHTTVKADLGLK